ncbi:MAG TPA: helix-turn-helix domain-containing protein [Vicinamibacteria bacterium]|nr:helix-turn-helix domain-containing protein [Vicinamibacteria bacterium]
MSMELGLGEALALLGVIHGFFLGLVLWTQARGHRTANRILAALVGLYSLHLLHIVLYWTRALAEVPHVWGFVWFFPYLYGPLLYLYVRALTEASFRLRRGFAVHFLPFVVCLLVFTRFYLLPAEVKRRLLESTYDSVSGSANPVVLTFWALQFVHFVCYLVASLRRLGESAGSEQQTLWLRRLFAAFALSFSCWFLYGIALTFGVSYSRGIDTAATMAMTVSIYGVGYTALRVPELFVGELLRLRRGRYEGSTLTEAAISEYRERLVAVMESNRPHVDANLRLLDLASLLEVPPYQLSQVINQGFGLRFNDFVNRYRVEEAKRLLSDPARRDESLLSLAFEAGFNNKTSFNQAFKKYTRMTPSRYREEISRQEA